jgi:hypothetical protein
MSEKHTFHATAVREGTMWAVDVHDLPHGATYLIYGSTMEKARLTAIKAVTFMLDIPRRETRVIITFKGENGETTCG